jgi:hypothetical protein
MAMKTGKKMGILCVALLLVLGSEAQVNYRAASAAIAVAGTSSLNNWELKSQNGTVTATFEMDENGKPIEVIGLSVTLGVASLKSGKTGLDNNAYRSLLVHDFAQIKFGSVQGTIKPSGPNYIVVCNGIMQVAGKSVNTSIVATCVLQADGSLSCTGTKDMKMTDFDITPPSFMLGTIKTGNEIKLSFSTVLKKY